MKIFLVQDGEATGPFDEGEIRHWLESGKLIPDTFATTEGLGEWKPVSEVLSEKNEPSVGSSELPPTLSATIIGPVQNPSVEQPVEPRDSNEDDPDLRRHAPEKEERIRSFAWLAVGLLYLIAFIWPTELADGMGIVNFHFEWANENLSWAAIPLMVWPGVAGVAMGAAGFLLRGRIRGALAVLISMLPLVLVLLVGGAGFVNMMEALSALEGIDLTQEAGRDNAIEKSFTGLRGLIGMGAAMLLAIIILIGVFSALYLTILLTPHAVRHLRPNSTKAFYFGLIAGVFLFLFQVMLIFFSLFSFFWGILFGLGMVMGLTLQMAAVIVGFTNTTSRSAKLAAKRALWSLGLGVGGLMLIILTLLFAPLIQGDMQAMIGMYVFKLFIWFTAVALVIPLGVMDLWLGKAADTPQNS